MFFEGDIKALLDAMRLKKNCIETGRPYDGPRILFVGGGGVMYGCEGGGTVTALYESGYGEVFDWVFGLSTSAPGVTYFLSGNPRVGTSVYYEECCSKEFLSPLRFHRPIDTSYLDRVFKGETGKGFNLNRVFSHRTELLVGVTNASTGKQCIVRPRTNEELHQALFASISIPGFTGKPVIFRGREYTDGAMSHPLPLKQLIGKLNPTHVLVLPNRTSSLVGKPPWFETLANNTVFRSRISPVMRAMARKRSERLRASLRFAKEDASIPIVFAWSEGTVTKFERDSEKVKAAAFRAEEQWKELLA